MSGECEICCGRKTIRLPVYRMVAVESTADDVSLDEASREFPCPKCSPNLVPTERLTTIREKIESAAPYASDPRYMEAMRYGMARLMAERMLRGGYITFEQSDPDELGRFSLRGRAGVVHPRHVAKFEERVAERQFEVAAALVEENKREIGNWGSYYHGREGGSVGKWQAIEWLETAFKKVRAKYAKG